MATNDDLAFPVEGFSDGMKLRDYFAAKASWDEISQHMPTTEHDCRQMLGLVGEFYIPTKHQIALVQMIKYRIADAMLSAREAKP